jgi:hypothetical protein
MEAGYRDTRDGGDPASLMVLQVDRVVWRSGSPGHVVWVGEQACREQEVADRAV